MRQRALASPVITRLADHQSRSFTDQAAWNAHLKTLGITALAVKPDPVMIATATHRPGCYPRRNLAALRRP
jgi:hypothetical protein